MKVHSSYRLGVLFVALSVLAGCARSGNDVWEDTKSAGRHVNRGLKAICGSSTDSRQVCGRGEFEGVDEEMCNAAEAAEMYGYQEGAQEFVPLPEQMNQELAVADMVAPPPRETPGEAGSSIPGIQAFRDPSTIPHLAPLFQTIYFEYDSSLVKGEHNLATIRAIADYMRNDRHLYVFVEGHTDERGPQAYNLALGSRRANAVRNLLISEGVSPDNLFTISYGKERPVVLELHEEGWAKNRRVEFKVYEK